MLLDLGGLISNASLCPGDDMFMVQDDAMCSMYRML